MGDSKQMDFWNRVYFGGDYSWSEIFDKYSATTDNPACEYWEDILKEYPNSKVILTTRNPESWVKSCKETIFNFVITPPFGIRFITYFRGTFTKFMDRALKCITGTDNSDQTMIKRFEVWNQSVIDKCPKEKLLIFEAKDGWSPLCKFLNKEVPTIFSFEDQ